MLRTVVFDANLPFLPSHVYAADEGAVFIDDKDLSLRSRKPGGDQQQPRPGFLW